MESALFAKIIFIWSMDNVHVCKIKGTMLINKIYNVWDVAHIVKLVIVII